jgi:hypothetical protein
LQLVEERHPIKPPPEATAEEYHCQWYSLTDRVSYLPGGLITGKVSYSACFHDLPNGLQTHCYAPMGLNIKGKWTLGGSLPGEPVEPVELGLGAPVSGLYLREDVDMKCNIMMTSFVKKTLKKAHSHLVDRLLVKAQIEDAADRNRRINEKSLSSIRHQYSGSTQNSPSSDYGDEQSMIEQGRDPGTYSGAPQIPPLQQSPSFSHRGPDSPDFRDKTKRDESLYPRTLSERSSTASNDGSATGTGASMTGGSGNIHGRISYHERPNQRVSWQNLTKSHTPPPSLRTPPAPKNAESAFQTRQQHQPYHAQSYPASSQEPTCGGQQQEFYAELDSTPVPVPQTYHAPANPGAAELE